MLKSSTKAVTIPFVFIISKYWCFSFQRKTSVVDVIRVCFEMQFLNMNVFHLKF